MRNMSTIEKIVFSLENRKKEYIIVENILL